jgi:hypothetical protein
MEDRHTIMFLCHQFELQCDLDVYLLVSILLEERKFNDFMQIVPKEIESEEEINKFNEICGNSSLSDREKIKSTLHQIPVTLLVAFAILTQDRRLELRNLLEKNRSLGPEQCASIYNRITSQTFEQDSSSEVASQSHESDSSSESESQMDEQDLSSEFESQTSEQDPSSEVESQTIKQTIMEDRHTIMFLCHQFELQCDLDVYLLVSILLEEGKFNDFMQIVPKEIESEEEINKFNEIRGNSSLSDREKIKSTLHQIPVTLLVAFAILTQDRRLELRNLLEKNRSLGPEQCASIYNRITSQTFEQDPSSEVASQSHEQDPSSESESQMDEQDLLTELTLENCKTDT